MSKIVVDFSDNELIKVIVDDAKIAASSKSVRIKSDVASTPYVEETPTIYYFPYTFPHGY